MNYNELYETDEALKNFVEEKKQGLINKNNQLIQKLKKSTTEATELTEHNNVMAGKLARYENEITNNLINQAFKSVEGVALLNDTDGIVKDYIYKNADGFNIKINDNAIVLADKDGKSFKEHFQEFIKTDTAKSFIKNPSSGGGARGSGAFIGPITKETLQGISSTELAEKLKNPDFRSQIDSYLKNNK